jgi:hypothetical protein
LRSGVLITRSSHAGMPVRNWQWGARMRMNIDDGRLITRFQRLITEMLVEKRLGQRRPELTDQVYQTWREIEQRGLKETPEYRNVLLRADRHALWAKRPQGVANAALTSA